MSGTGDPGAVVVSLGLPHPYMGDAVPARVIPLTSTLGIEVASRGSGFTQTPHRWRKSTSGWIRQPLAPCDRSTTEL